MGGDEVAAVPGVGAVSPRLQDVLAEHPAGRGSFGSSASCEGCEWTSETGSWWTTHAEHQAAVWREACTVRTAEEVDALPVGAVVLALWADTDGYPVPVVSRYIDGWFGFPALQPLHPLGSGRNGETAVLIWHPGWLA